MIIGIKQTPQKGALPKVEVFYCGRDGVEFRKQHAALMAAENPEGTKFFSITNPLLIPLQNVAHSTEDHPDIIAAQKKRAAIAKAAGAKSEQTELMPETLTAETLAKKPKPELLELADRLKVSLVEKSTKAEIITAILAAKATPPETGEGNENPEQ